MTTDSDSAPGYEINGHAAANNRTSGHSGLKPFRGGCGIYARAAWEDSYGRLARFAEREGHSRVPALYRDDDGFQLGAWVAPSGSSEARTTF